ncbi:DUF2147 domain-containing protein [Aestuariivirga sp.]|uniref:DUF2147 domain-containing protein n=1 Tax=Aestuariivirga sp. TaxID=2650926 RepID=UPI0025BAADCC|nr:DUF2147 domain-containing protein [Aestuariivirga sp.]MCA3556094.1 DUF2147 domain-containing protein [Aestuariivirga sp.]
MRWVALTLASIGMTVAAVPSQAAGGPTGIWRMSNGKVTVKVSPCGGGYCGKVVALRKPHDGHGRPRLDKENPNPALRQRPVIGLTILSNMQSDGADSWVGTIYNPDDGNTYSSWMQLTGPSTMKVSGCVAGIFCKTMKFIRVD